MELIAHELGHWLNLPEAFKARGNIIAIISINNEGDTKHNFMDYNIRRKRWYKIQLINQKH